jgi:hypothetical protein
MKATAHMDLCCQAGSPHKAGEGPARQSIAEVKPLDQQPKDEFALETAPDGVI